MFRLARLDRFGGPRAAEVAACAAAVPADVCQRPRPLGRRHGGRAMHRLWRTAVAVAVVAVSAGAKPRGHDVVVTPHRPFLMNLLRNFGSGLEGDGPYMGPPSVQVHDHARAGFPLEESPHAKPGRTPAYCGGYVGGGRPLTHKVEDGRGPNDGTWGWDYVGPLGHPRRVFLGWWHDRKQPFSGPYNPDGPYVPDIIADNPLRRAIERLGEHKGEGEGEGEKKGGE